MRGFLATVGILVLVGTAGADYKACREAWIDKLWDQAFKACHAEAVKAERGEGPRRGATHVQPDRRSQAPGAEVEEGHRVALGRVALPRVPPAH